MYNLETTSYTSDKRSLYLALSVIGASLISYIPNQLPIDYTSSTKIEMVDCLCQGSDAELTRHAMNLSESSLAEDWADEDDDHWASFYK